MIDKIVSIYSFIDDMLKAINHREDAQRTMNDAEIISIGVIASLFFAGYHELALTYCKENKIFSNVLSKSRFNRRIHKVDEIMVFIFGQLGNTLKEFNTAMHYRMDCFPIRVCHNIRISRCKILPKDEEFRGKCVSKREYFYGVKICLMTNETGIPVEFSIVPGRWSDTRAMDSMFYDLPDGSINICDSGFTSYQLEDLLLEAQQIKHDTVRKSNSKRTEPYYIKYLKDRFRKYIETVIANITRKIPVRIHATTFEGFLLKLKFWIWAYTLDRCDSQ